MYVAFLLLSLCAVVFNVLAQEPSETFFVSSECTNQYGEPQMCYPPFTSAAADQKVIATNTCGERARQKYCIHMSTTGMATRCQYCDSRNPMESHFAEYMTDKNPNNWWQSETMADNSLLHFKESVNLTIDLGTQFHVNYVYLQFRSPRPHAMVIYKRFDDKSDWTPWAYFSSNCITYFNMNYNPRPTFHRADEVICQEEYSTLQPLYGGEVIFSVINGRPNYDRFFEDKDLQLWSTATQIRVELKKMHTFGDERGAERDTLLTYYFAIEKFTVGGRCLCHGHGNECRKSTGPGQKERLVCVCDPSHHTSGDNCEQCTADHHDVPWLPATPESANPCRPCKCNGNSHLCEFDRDLFDRTGSGSRCIGCGNNTEGINCELCKTGFFNDPVIPTVCQPCSCDPIGTMDGAMDCSKSGQCVCKPGVGGQRCDRCLDDYYGFSAGGCQPCNCTVDGSLDNRPMCDSRTGQCLCKQNVNGRQCERCKIGHYGLMSNDPLGCKPCLCSLHSSECELDSRALAESFGRPGESVELSSLVKPNQVIVNCPEGQQPCPVCVNKDPEHIHVNCNGTSEGYLPCLCQKDPNLCEYCPSSVFHNPQIDPRTEICTCPPQYIGKSCESCAPGHRRDPPSGLVTDRCIPCTCNNHSTVCHPETGQCVCLHNTGGLFCDRCADGYYGDALAPVTASEACKACPCPPGVKCEEVHLPDRRVEVVCKDCPDNRAGIRCERCAENYYGDPLNGIPCKLCDCSDNVDPREFGNCDGKTGECLKCIFGTTGKHCEKCLSGYRRNFKPSNRTGPGSALVPARGCSPCNCDPVGTLGIGICNSETGQCPCKPGVGGLQCQKCYSGFYGFRSGQGCQACDCNSIGAVGESCDDNTGWCECRPHVTGRQCDKCLPGFFNMTSTHGCEDCACHTFGSESRQCNSTGWCTCKPFAVGKKCDQCKENHYSLEAGCLPCPACYNLVQARVDKLRGMLLSVFGPIKPDSKPGSYLSPDDKDLYAEVIKLNNTLVTLYRNVLDIGGKSSVVDSKQLTRTIEGLARQVEVVKADFERIRTEQPNCTVGDLDAQLTQLENDINEKLETLLDGEVRSALEDLKDGATRALDPVLTSQANQVADLAHKLQDQGNILKDKMESSSRLVANLTAKLTESEKAVTNSKNLLDGSKQKSDAIERGTTAIRKEIADTDALMQKSRNQQYKIQSEIRQIPDLRSEVRLLEGVSSRWQEGRNTSKQLQGQLLTLAAEVENTLDRFRRVNSQLRTALNEKHNQAKQLEPSFHEIKTLFDRVIRARNISQRAYAEAQNKLEKLQDFEEYVSRTKSLVPDAMEDRENLEEKLTQVEASVKDLHDQARFELEAAQKLANRTERLQKILDTLNSKISEGKNLTKFYENQLRKMRSQPDVDVSAEVSKSQLAVKEAEEEANRVRELVEENHESVESLTKDASDMFTRMKNLKDRLTKTNGGKLPANGEDAATRFAKLKAEAKKLHLNERLDYLRELNRSRTIELNYLRSELAEIKAHYQHLVRVDSLLPPSDGNCFYTGKEIEGEEPSSSSI